MATTIGSVSLFILLVGCALAVASNTYTACVDIIEYVAGALIVAGLTLLGIGLEFALNPSLTAGWP